MPNVAKQVDMKIRGTGKLTLPPGVTRSEAERLVREAQEKKRKGS